MNAFRKSKQNRLHLAVWLAIPFAVTLGCKEVTSPGNPPPLNTLAGEIPGSEDASPGPAVRSDEQSSHTPNASLPDTVSANAISANPVSPDHVESSEGSRDAAAAPRGIPLVPKESSALPATKPAKVYEPKVVLSQAHQTTCLVNVGDTLPDLALQSLEGEPVSLSDLRGDALTVVVFWTNRLAFAREQVARLSAEVALPFRHLGVKVVAVNVGDPIEQIELDADTLDVVTCVLDPDGAATAKVATSKLPRTYLIDSEGHVLWFDIEYSRTTRRQLKNAIFFHSRDESSAS